MARDSYQKGSLEWKNGKPRLRYWERVSTDPEEWKHRSFNLDKILKGDRSKKQMHAAIDGKMKEINEANNCPIGLPMPTVEEFVENQWEVYLRSAGKIIKRSSAQTRKHLLDKHILPAFGSKRLNEITVMDITTFCADRKHYKGNYQNMIYTLVASIFKAAVALEILQMSPIRPEIHKPKVEKTNKHRLTSDELTRVLQVIPDKDKILALVIAVTSMRIGEIMGLWWMNFNEVAGTIEVTHTLYGKWRQEAKTEASKQIIELPSAVVTALKVHRARSGFTKPTDYIFCRNDGRPMRYGYLIEDVLRPALKAIGINRVPYMHGFHLFRRSCAKLLYELCRDTKMVQEYLRHSDMGTTMAYIGDVDSVRGEATGLIADNLGIPLLVPQESLTVQ